MKNQENLNNIDDNSMSYASNREKPRYSTRKKLNSKTNDRKRKNLSVPQNIVSTREKIGKNIDFASSEAYKLLRTNLTFTLNNNEKCNILGMTSSIPGEGKSTTCINLAISLAEVNKRVLLIEGDMRKPVLEKYFNIKTNKGLSTALAGICKPKDVVYKSSKYQNLYIITAGEIPPNPAELLSSSNMENLLSELKNSFDIILIDLPPVTAVVDPIVVSKLTQGMVVVVRDGYVHKNHLAETIGQLRLANAKILGIIYNSKHNKKGISNKYYGTYQEEYKY